MHKVIIAAASIVGLTQGHMGAYHKGMYCIGGPNGNDGNNNVPSAPLYQLPKDKWWFQAVHGCDKRPPKQGDFLELPVGGEFTVEIASNQAFTHLSYDGRMTSEFVDNKKSEGEFKRTGEGCVWDPNLHAQDLNNVSGSAFAISYHSEIKDVTPENLVVFTVNHQTPWRRIAKFKVPKDLPPCPPGGCTCAWGWIPKGCGQPNMYMMGYKCNVTGSQSTKKVGVAKPPVWCQGEPGKCVKGPKQMLFWQQQSGDNIKVAPGQTPVYNDKCGFKDGAQDDIFIEGAGTPPGVANVAAAKPAKPAKPAKAKKVGKIPQTFTTTAMCSDCCRQCKCSGN